MAGDAMGKSRVVTEYSRHVAVVGAGAAGLAAAFQLERSGHRVELIERDTVLGGRFGVGTLGDRPVMFGGKNIGRRYTSLRAFAAAMGHNPWEPFGINASRVKDGKVLTLDSSRRGRSLAALREVGSPRDLMRLVPLAARILANEQNRYLGAPPFAAVARKHDHAPLSAHFGPEMTRLLLRPITVRMNGTEPDQMYLGTINTNLASLMDTYDQLQHGIQPALEAFAERVSVRFGVNVEGLTTSSGAITGLRAAHDGGPVQEESYDGVVLATPAYATADIVRDTRAHLAERLDCVRYAPSTVVLVEYDRPLFTPQVRALSLDDGGPCSNAGSYGMEDRHIVRYTFSGRPAGLEEPSAESLAGWVDAAEETLAQCLSITPGERVRTASRHWRAAYCAYVPFVGDFLTDVHAATAGMPGLELAGDYLKGVALEACFRSGTEAGVRLAAQFGEASATPVALSM
jgi:protoporphyrinogen/coproporphyrinogen III oxidase